MPLRSTVGRKILIGPASRWPFCWRGREPCGVGNHVIFNRDRCGSKRVQSGKEHFFNLPRSYSWFAFPKSYVPSAVPRRVMDIYYEPSVFVPIASLFHRAALMPGFGIVGFTGDEKGGLLPIPRGYCRRSWWPDARSQAARRITARRLAAGRRRRSWRHSTGLPGPALDVAQRLRR